MLRMGLLLLHGVRIHLHATATASGQLQGSQRKGR
jgi:hypothetical protein